MFGVLSILQLHGHSFHTRLTSLGNVLASATFQFTTHTHTLYTSRSFSSPIIDRRTELGPAASTNSSTHTRTSSLSHQIAPTWKLRRPLEVAILISDR